MNLIPVLLALINSLGVTLGGRTGSLVTQIVGTISTVTLDKAAFDAFAGPWIAWANVIVDAKRDPTPEEEAKALELAAAIHANNQSLGAGGPPVALPTP